MTTLNPFSEFVKPSQYTPADRKALRAAELEQAYQDARERRYREYEVGNDYRKRAAMRPTLVKITAQGRLVKAAAISSKPTKAEHNITFHRRGKVIDFSQGSRRRCLNFAQTIDTTKPARFLTLTYQGVQTDAIQAKKHLRALLKRIMRHCSKTGEEKIAFWWRQELQERGAIHFHVIMWGTGFIHWSVLRDWWAEIAGLDTSRPINIKIEYLDTHKKLFNYVSKYVAKRGSSNLDSVTYLAAPGRCWGIEGREHVPLCEEFVLWTTPRHADIWKIRAQATVIYEPIAENPCFGFTLYIDNASEWLFNMLKQYPSILDTDIMF